MVPTSSNETTGGLSTEHAAMLLEVARRAVDRAVREGLPLDVDPGAFPEALAEPRATFVTIERAGTLYGCIGSLEARTSTVEDVAKNAYGAIRHDPRCPHLRPSDVPELDVHISVLSAPVPMAFDSEEDLVRQLRPGVDGLVLQEGARRGTFLPAVWESLPDPHDFLAHLKTKAGLPPTYWSPTLRVSRYTTDVIG
jgi:AmmeMemoRadiSam system protein A